MHKRARFWVPAACVDSALVCTAKNTLFSNVLPLTFVFKTAAPTGRKRTCVLNKNQSVCWVLRRCLFRQKALTKHARQSTSSSEGEHIQLDLVPAVLQKNHSLTWPRMDALPLAWLHLGRRVVRTPMSLACVVLLTSRIYNLQERNRCVDAGIWCVKLYLSKPRRAAQA